MVEYMCKGVLVFESRTLTPFLFSKALNNAIEASYVRGFDKNAEGH